MGTRPCSRPWSRPGQGTAGGGHRRRGRVGKSRLVYEVIYSTAPRLLVLESASVSYGKATPYFQCSTC